MQSVTWRPYQVQCKKAIHNNFQKGVTEQLIVQATGTGKRLQAINLIGHFSKVLFVAHREELINQAYNDIVRFYPRQCGIIKFPTFDPDQRITVASVQTLYNRLEFLRPDQFDLLIIDEAHHYVAKTYLETLRFFKSKLTTLWTATPKRLDNLSLSNIAEKIVFEYKIEDGITDGWLAGIEAYQVQTDIDLSNVKKVAGDFNQKELSQKVDCIERNNMIVERYEKYCTGEQAVAFCVDIDHAYNLRDAFLAKGYRVEAVVSDISRCPNRAEILDQFARGEIDVLTNVNILTEGYDYSDIGCILMARPTQSESLYIQCIGRGTRIKSSEFEKRFNHNSCIVLDFVDNAGKHSLVNAYELEKGKPIEDRIFISSSHKQKLIEAREKRERMMKISRHEDKRVDLLRLPKTKVWKSRKMLEPATEKQIKWLKDIGMYQDGVEYTKAMASEIISFLPASYKDMSYLRMHGYDVSEGATKGQVSRVRYKIESEKKYQIK